MRASGRLLFPLLLTLCALVASTSADVKDDLRKRGVRISSSSATLSAESEVAGLLKDVTALRRKLFQATSQHNDHKKGDAALDGQIARLNQQLVNLNAQLANVQDVVTNNRLVGAIGTIEGQLRLCYDGKEQRAKLESSLHDQISKARDALITHIVDMRKAADDVARQYYAADKETQELINQFNQDTGSTVALQPSSVFLASLRRLEELEGDILAEDIKLKREGNTYWASVKLNGEHAVNMVVDSGASTILLPFDEAAKAGISPGNNDPVVQLGVADGRSTTGRLMTIKSLQLGGFTAENVECVVLNAGVKAEPLLGMTFLGRFKFQLDAGKSTLSLVRVRDSSSEKSGRSSKLQPLQLIRSDWKLVPAAVEIPLWNNRPYKIQTIPEELKGASMVLRKVESQDWPAGEIVAHEPALFSVAIRTNRLDPKTRKHVQEIDDETVANLKNQGWKLIEGFSAIPEPKEKWKWRWVLLQKRFEEGPITVTSLIPTQEVAAIFFVGPANRP